MASFIQNIIWNSVEGFVEAGKKTAGEYGGNALIKAGDMIENGGRSVGTGIERKATSYGTAITGQTYKPSATALPSTARKPVIKRSNSTPANSKPTTSGAKGGSGIPIGAKKYPGGSQVNGAVGGAKNTVGGASKVMGGVVGGGQKALGGVTGNASKVTGGVVGRANSTIGGVSSNASKAAGGLVGGSQKALGGATRSIPPFKGPNSVPAGPSKTSLLKPLPGTNGTPKPAYPSEKKTPVKPGQPKPFKPPVESKKLDPKKPYPGTNTLPGTSKTPVQQHRLKPLPRLGPQVGQGQTMQHISV
ncbi:Caprin-1-C domain containing protein [Pyrenophora tritici-repentis]|uniref:TT-ORF1 multi-domain protein n=2 Tax=Pyrenophora tritici-repentis TaxID=45151 RepID=A0A2W1FCF5_9PLEO|nr:uncharacterized protein PTRG_11689 [Pyrenophora tritici-repentis Pt-1C-BFP]KAA8627220.1 hypothetical protein PtrV1_02900 [Pyrenophora tritici-repentis]EDU44739.1 hypothetical protein PTRG_11689 [Pyrenophora tritici-repentis Pt-1C-BFP]KAF7455640.1 hypothetical protein A1F99_028980 [Pyrenophora tritici-repentis]KAF7578839.1 TT-ORF1 multi-domain protein [Pyrenophora tritici-repentis]KAG9389387.1 hypothetical protein A1F94_002280 [Pyrenophora tritici-repentis]